MHQLFKGVDNATVDNPLFSLLLMQQLVIYPLNNTIQQGQRQVSFQSQSQSQLFSFGLDCETKKIMTIKNISEMSMCYIRKKQVRK